MDKIDPKQVPFIKFKIPSKKERIVAFGGMAGFPFSYKKQLNIINSFPFSTISQPTIDDWLSVEPESGQPFDQYTHSGFNDPKEGNRTKIYIARIQLKSNLEYNADSTKTFSQVFLKKCKQFCSTFFSPLRVVLIKKTIEVTPEIIQQTTLTPSSNYKKIQSLEKGKVYARFSSENNLQLCSSQLLSLLRKKLPKDGYCIIGITMSDMYPSIPQSAEPCPGQSFVGGLSTLKNRCGVFSFLRMDPKFMEFDPYYDLPEDQVEACIFYRSCKLLAHEISHIFGMTHCIYYECCMKGSNHVLERDNTPLFHCPICVRKLQYALNFNFKDRYSELSQFCKNNGEFFKQDAIFFQKISEILQ